MTFFGSVNIKNASMSFLLALLMTVLASGVAHAQYNNTSINPPPPVPDKNEVDKGKKKDDVKMRYGVHPTIPENYDDLKEGEYAADLKNPSNITTLVRMM